MMTSDQEETARLIMMEMRDRGTRSLVWFNTELRAQLNLWDSSKLTIGDVTRVWHKYMGIDRLLPTHDLDTGERLR